jgi:hypothetical protein
MDAFAAVAVVAALGLIAGTVLSFYRRDRIDGALIAALALLAGLLLLSALAYATDYRDADGVVDCWPRCTGFQQVLARSFVVGGIAWVVLLMVVFVRAATKKVR